MTDFNWKYRIGVIYIASSVTLEWEWHHILPSDISFHVARIELKDGQADEAYLTEMMESKQIEKASKMLGELDVDVIVFCCTIGSLIKGKGWDQELLDRIEKHSGGVQATSTSTGLLEALKVIESKGVNIVTPYIKELNQLEKKFLMDNNFNVVNIDGCGCKTDFEIARVEPNYFVKKILGSANKEWDCAFISCTNSNTLEAINRIEKESGKYALSSNQVSLWASLKKIGYPLIRVKNYGRIFDL